MDFRQLSYLRQVASSSNFREAADELGVSPSGLSQGLSRLQRRIGLPLLERRGRRRAPTDEGWVLVGFARRVLAEAEALEEELDRRERGELGALRVGMIDAAGLYLLPATVRSYRAQYPDVDLALSIEGSEVLVQRVMEGDLDLAFVVAPAEGVESEEILVEPLFVYAARGSRGGPDQVEWFLYPSGSHTRIAIDQALARLGLEPRVTLESGNPSVLRQMADLGLGWTVLPATVAESGGRPLRRWGEAIGERRLLAVRRVGSAPDLRAARFLDLVQRQHP